MNEREWYYVKDGQRYGPVPQTTLTQLLSDGTLGPATLVWTQPMENWQQASTIDFSAQAVWSPPPPGSPVTSQAFRPARPTAVTVFGVLNIVFGGLGLLCMPVALIAIFAAPNMMNVAGGARAWTLVSTAVGLFCTIFQITMGIGLLYLKAWARMGSLAYGWFAVIWGIIGMAVNFATFASAAHGSSPDATFGLISGIFGGLIGMIYPVLLIIFMRKPNVKDACTR